MKRFKLAHLLGPVLVLLAAVGCAHSKQTPALATSPGGMDAQEMAACEDFDCKNFLAPCSLKEHSPLYTAPESTAKPIYLSLMEERYLREFEELPKAGYCQLPPRSMRADLYNKDTCIYVFVKRPDCRSVSGPH